MIFDWIDWGKKYEFMVILTKKNKKPIAILSEAYDRNLEVNVDTFNKFTFTVPKYIADRFSHEQIDNPNYDKVIEENMVLVKAFEEGKPNDIKFQSYFIIKNTEETTDESAKKVQCSSREVMLNKNIITIDGLERQLNKDSVNTADGIFDILAQETTWKLGHIDESARIEHINGGTNNKYRWFDALSKPWYDFLQTDVTTAFNVVLEFDTVNKLVNCYDKTTWGKHTGIILSEENYIKNLSKKGSSDNLVTKLEVSGRDGLGISDVNIWGGDYLYNWDFFKQNGQMSDELIEALDKYESLLETKNTEFQSLRTQVVNVLSQIDVKNGEMTQLNEELKALRLIQAGYMSSNDNTNLPQATTNVNNKVIAIANKQAEITNLTTQKDNLNTQINQIALDIRTDNAKDSNGNLIFDDELNDELSEFTYTESWNNDYYANSDALLKGGQDILKGWSVPTIDFEVDMADVFGTPETYRMWDKLNFKNGDFVRFYSKRFKISTDERIVGYNYGIDKNDLKISFSNKNKKSDDARSIGGAIKKGAEANKVISVKKLSWDEIKNTKNAVDLFLNNALDLGRQEIVAQMGKNKISIDEFGIFVIDSENEDHQVCLLSGILGFTQDGWKTCNTLLDNTGLYAKYLVGQIILGEQLFIQDTTGQFSIVGNLLTIKDGAGNTKVQLGEYALNKWGLKIIGQSGNVVLDESGILQTMPYTREDNLDSLNPLSFTIIIPPEATSVRSAKLYFKLIPFRSYEKSIVLTSSGSHRHKLFSYLGEELVDMVNMPFYKYVFSNNSGGSYPIATWLPLSPASGSGDISGSYSPPELFSYTADGNHSHPTSIERGIFTYTTAANVDVYVDKVRRLGAYNSDQSGIELRDWLQTPGEHLVELTSTNLGRIHASILVTAFLTT